MFYLLKIWFNILKLKSYYKTVIMSDTHASGACKYAHRVSKIYTKSSDVTEFADDYAHYMLGHYILNIAAKCSRSLFFEIVISAPQNIRYDADRLSRHIGKMAFDDYTPVFSKYRRPDYMKRIYGLVNDIPTTIELGKPSPLNFISYTTLWDSTLVNIIHSEHTQHTTKLSRDKYLRSSIEETARLERLADLWGYDSLHRSLTDNRKRITS